MVADPLDNPSELSVAVGRCGKRLEWQAIPPGRVGNLPDEVWLDTGPPSG